MELEKDFKKWLMTEKRKKNGALLGNSSAYKYTRAINSISEDMMKAEIIDKHLYNIYSSKELQELISRIKENNAFNKKNETGHNMYSVALDHYFDFISNR